MAQYRVALKSQGGTHKYVEATRTLHITINDLFSHKPRFGNWCYDDIMVTSIDTMVSVVFKPWQLYDANSMNGHYVAYHGTYGGERLVLKVWKDAETRDRNVVFSALSA